LSLKWNKINSGQQRTLLQGLSHWKKIFLRSLIFFHSSRFWKHTHIHTYIISVTMFRYIQVELSSEWKMIFFSCIGQRQREEELIRTSDRPKPKFKPKPRDSAYQTENETETEISYHGSQLLFSSSSSSSSALLEVTNCFRMWEVLRKEKKCQKRTNIKHPFCLKVKQNTFWKWISPLFPFIKCQAFIYQKSVHLLKL